MINWLRITCKLTIFPKLVIVFLLVIAPLYMLGLWVNVKGASSIREELSKSLQAKVEFYLNSLEAEKNHIAKLQQEYSVDPDLQSINFIGGIMDPFDFTQTVLRIQNKLQLVKGSSVYIENVSVHMLTINRTVSSNKPMTDILNRDFEGVRNELQHEVSPIIYWHDRMFIALPFAQPVISGKLPAYVVVVELSVNELKKALRQFTNSNENSGAILMNIKQNGIVANEQDIAKLHDVQQFLQIKFNKHIWEGVEALDVQDTLYLVAYKYSALFGSYLAVYVPQKEVLGKLDLYRILFWLYSFLSTLLIVVFSYWIYRLLHKPLTRLIRAFRKVEQGQLEPIALPRTNDEFYYLFKHFNKMVEQLKVLIHEVYEQKIRSQGSELKQLQSQINPHFLYNTYFILYRLAKMNDNESVIRLSHYLGEYFQFITRNAASEVELEVEVRHARTYIEIQCIRFSNRIQAVFAEIPEESKMLIVPRLTLQPIIENAYFYGMEGKRKGGQIWVDVTLNEGILLITVRDNGDKLTDERLQELQKELLRQDREMEYTGLLNVHRRLQLRFGSNSGIFLSRATEGGLRVEMRIEYEKG